jgi:hypothetical protein
VKSIRIRSKAPVAVAGILAVPLFFVGLMAFSLRFDKPSEHVTRAGRTVLGDPTKGTLATIYGLALLVAAAVVIIGLLASLLRTRLATVIPAIASIVASILLMVPLGTWAAAHTARYPYGTDNIRDLNPQNLMHRAEWEQNAKKTADEIAWVTIGMSIAAIVLTAALEIRRRRGIEGPPVPPPPLDSATVGELPRRGLGRRW